MTTALTTLKQERQQIDDLIRHERFKNIKATIAKLPLGVVRNMLLAHQLVLGIGMAMHIGNRIEADDKLDLLEIHLNIE